MDKNQSYGGDPIDPNFVASPCGFSGITFEIKRFWISTIPIRSMIAMENKFRSLKPTFKKIYMVNTKNLQIVNLSNGSIQKMTILWFGWRPLLSSPNLSFGDVLRKTWALESTILWPKTTLKSAICGSKRECKL